ncbi:hypothetical protein ACU4GD_13325 [Cupriavidus basilensis]
MRGGSALVRGKEETDSLAALQQNYFLFLSLLSFFFSSLRGQAAALGPVCWWWLSQRPLAMVLMIGGSALLLAALRLSCRCGHVRGARRKRGGREREKAK